MAVPRMNNDIIAGSMDPKTGQYKIAKKNQEMLLTIIDVLQARIDIEMGVRVQGPLRFLIPLAMRFTEQAGPMSFRKPKGNNPYNIMGTGVDRPDNTEFEGGREVKRPASFQGYGSDAEGVAAFFQALRTAHGGIWKGAWDAIREVSSFDAFARGLRPKGAFHYLTRPLPDHIQHLTGRGREALNLLEVIYKSEQARLRNESADDEVLFPALLDDPLMGPDVAQRLRISRRSIKHADEMLRRIASTRARLKL